MIRHIIKYIDMEIKKKNRTEDNNFTYNEYHAIIYFLKIPGL